MYENLKQEVKENSVFKEKVIIEKELRNAINQYADDLESYETEQ